MSFDALMGSPWFVAVLVVGIVWLLANMKTSRPDGKLVGKVHPYRQIMQYIMPTRTESVVLFDSHIDATELLAYLAESKSKLGANVTHCMIGALAHTLASAPSMNNFIAGRRVYRRNERQITFSMKRKKLDKEAKLATVKTTLKDGETFAELVTRINTEINRERSGERTYQDKEFDLFGYLPRFVMVRAVALLRQLDYYNLLPASFIGPDPLYTSVVMTNLGSLGMGAGYHHLFEWGNCPFFLMGGKIEDKPVVIDGEVVVRKVMHVRYTYDERVDDGLSAKHGIVAFEKVLENPATYLGCLEDDGSDARALDLADEGKR